MTANASRGHPPPNRRLAAAAAASDWSGVFAAVTAGADPNLPVFDGGTVLHCAIYEGQPDVALRLLALGASAQAIDEFGRTPLHWIAELGGLADFEPLLQALCKAGANVNAADTRGRTPLHAAAIRGHAPTVEQLLKAGAEVNVQKSDGLTPLHFAMVRKHQAVADLLITHGADPHRLAANGATPASLASMLGLPINAAKPDHAP